MGHLIREPSPPPAAPPKPTLNQLRNSFSPPEQKQPETSDLMDAFQPKSVPLPAAPFNFGSVQMAQPPAEPMINNFKSSPMYPVQQAPANVNSANNFIPGFDPAPAQPQKTNVLPNPSTITPEVAAMLLKQIQETNPALLSSLGLVSADQAQQKPKDDPEAFRLPAPPSASNPVGNGIRRNGPVQPGPTPSTSGAGIDENGWQQLEKRHSLNGQENGGLPEGNKENNGQEPIWVMRDSYLKRLQREEQRSKEMQNGNTPGSSNGEFLNIVDNDNHLNYL